MAEQEKKQDGTDLFSAMGGMIEQELCKLQGMKSIVKTLNKHGIHGYECLSFVMDLLCEQAKESGEYD